MTQFRLWLGFLLLSLVAGGSSSAFATQLDIASSPGHVLSFESQIGVTLEAADEEHCVMHHMGYSCSGCPVCSGIVTVAPLSALLISSDHWSPFLEVDPKDPISGDRFRPPIA